MDEYEYRPDQQELIDRAAAIFEESSRRLHRQEAVDQTAIAGTAIGSMVALGGVLDLEVESAGYPMVTVPSMNLETQEDINAPLVAGGGLLALASISAAAWNRIRR